MKFIIGARAAQKAADSFEIKELSLGTFPPRITGIKVHDKEKLPHKRVLNLGKPISLDLYNAKNILLKTVRYCISKKCPPPFVFHRS